MLIIEIHFDLELELCLIIPILRMPERRRPAQIERRGQAFFPC